MLSGQVLFVSRSHRKEEIRPKMEGCVMSYNTGILTADSDLEGSHIIRDCISCFFLNLFFYSFDKKKYFIHMFFI